MRRVVDSRLQDRNTLSSDDPTMTEVTEKAQPHPTKGTSGLGNGAQAEARDRQVAAELTRLASAQMSIASAITVFNATLLVFVLREVGEGSGDGHGSRSRRQSVRPFLSSRQ
jgi:hypothetical protein